MEGELEALRLWREVWMGRKDAGNWHVSSRSRTSVERTLRLRERTRPESWENQQSWLTDYKTCACSHDSRRESRQETEQGRRSPKAEEATELPEQGAGAPPEGAGGSPWGFWPGTLLTGSRSRRSGPSWQRAKRTVQCVHGLPARRTETPASREGLRFPSWGGDWPGTGQVTVPSLAQGLAGLRH